MRIASPPPPYCSSCFGQYPDRLHIDMEAVYDGPVIAETHSTYNIEDLIVCELCLRNAINLLPEKDEQRDTIISLQAQLDNALDYTVKLTKAIERMEEAIKVQPSEDLARRAAQTQRKQRQKV